MLRKSLPKIMPNLWKVYFPAVYIIQNYVSLGEFAASSSNIVIVIK